MLRNARKIQWLMGCLAVATMCLAAGCASMDPDAESDLPWNTPQPWEGSPGLPGLEGR